MIDGLFSKAIKDEKGGVLKKGCDYNFTSLWHRLFGLGVGGLTLTIYCIFE